MMIRRKALVLAALWAGPALAAQTVAAQTGPEQTWQTQRGGPGRWHCVDVVKLNQDDATEANEFLVDGEPMHYVVIDGLWQVSEIAPIADGSVYDFDLHVCARPSVAALMNIQPAFSTAPDFRYVDPPNDFDVSVIPTTEYEATESTFTSYCIEVTRRSLALPHVEHSSVIPTTKFEATDVTLASYRPKVARLSEDAALPDSAAAPLQPSGAASGPTAVPPATTYPDFRQVVQDAKSKVFPAVVFIRCVRESNEMGKKESQQVSGSGVLVSADGEVLTNWHVIDKALSIRCLLSDGRHAEAKVLGSDKDTDLALLKLSFDKSPELPFARLGDSRRLLEGDFVMSMGAPWGLNRSVAIGIISCTTRYLENVSEYSLYLQTDAAINPGNSGGPLVNTAGEIIGINSRGMSGSADGMGFAIPSETIAVLLPQLREKGQVSWSWTGLQLQPLHDFNKDMFFEETEGVIVAETDPDSPARAAGIRARDRIIRVNGEAVTAQTEESLPALRRKLGLLARDSESTFEVTRGTETLTFKIKPREKGKVEGDEFALERLDFTVKTINQFDNPDLFFHRQKGIFVFGVKYPGNASNAGLSNKDIILKIDGKDITTLDDIKAVHKSLIDGLSGKSRVVISVLRGGLLRQIVLDYSRDYSKE